MAQETGHELSSGPNRLVVDRDTGRIRSLTGGGRALIVDDDGSLGPFRLHVPLPDFEGHMIEGHATKPVITETSDGISLRYPSILGKRGPMDLHAEYTITAVGDGSFELQLTLRNNSEFTLPQVFFPWIGGFVRVDGDDDQVTFGNGSFNPWKRWRQRSPREKVQFFKYQQRPHYVVQPFYPYEESGRGSGLMKWLDIGGQSMGTSLYSKDTGAKAQFMLISAAGYGTSTTDLAWFFYPFVKPRGGEWTSPVYVLSPHEGDWHQGVLKFKEFTDPAFTPVDSSPALDETVGSQTLWISWHYQDWQDLRYRFEDIPAIAAEARQAGFRHMMLSRATALDFCLPHVVRTPLGTDRELKAAIEKSRKLGVEIPLFVTCRIIRPDTIPEDQDKNEWWFMNEAGLPYPSNWTYDPHMIPTMPINQLGSRAGFVICAGSKRWREAYWNNLDRIGEKWGVHGLLFDISCAVEWGLCFNPLHGHRPDEEVECLREVLSKTRSLLQERHGEDALLIGEGQWDVATQWLDYTWDWDPLSGPWTESFAPFHMAFPRARRCCKTADDKALINRIFVSGYLIDLYLEEGGGRLGDYPELSAYFASLARFKKRFVEPLARRDTYLHDMFIESGAPEAGIWARTHRRGDEALILITQKDGRATSVNLSVNAEGILGKGAKTVEVWARTLKKITRFSCGASFDLRLDIPEEDFIGAHLTLDR